MNQMNQVASLDARGRERGREGKETAHYSKANHLLLDCCWFYKENGPAARAAVFQQQAELWGQSEFHKAAEVRERHYMGLDKQPWSG